MPIKPVITNLLLVILVSILFVTLSFLFGYASNPNRYPTQLLILYVVLISIHLILNWYWHRVILTIRTLTVLSLGICVLYAFSYRFLV
jgi:hypothetical protein